MDANNLRQLLAELGLASQAQRIELLLQLREVAHQLPAGYYYFDADNNCWYRRRVVVEKVHDIPPLKTDTDLSMSVSEDGTFEVKVPRRKPSFVDKA